MKKKSIIKGKVTKMLFGGKSIVTDDLNNIIYVKGGLLGQTVNVVIKKKSDNYYKGYIKEVLDKSELETENTCKVYGLCGGCSMLSIPYEKQLSLKSEMLMNLFNSYGHDDITKIDVLPSPSNLEYKNKMEFSFGDFEKGGELTLGMHRKNSPFSVVDASSCILVNEDFRKIIELTINFCRERNYPHYNIRSKEGLLRHLILRHGKNTSEIMVNIVTTTQMDFDMETYKNALLDLNLSNRIVSIFHTFNDSFSDAVIPEKVDLVFGEDHFTDKINSKVFKISPFSFFQTNTNGAELLYSTAISMIENKNCNIFDLYSGTGTIGLSLSSESKHITCIEIVPEAVEMAKENAVLNNIENITFICGDVKEKISELPDDPELIILDPPRSGINPKALRDIIGFNSKGILYISCNPKSLAEDLVVLKNSGYSLKKITAVDMFPNTNHVEVISYLEK